MIKIVLIEASISKRILIQGALPDYCTVFTVNDVSEAENLLSTAFADAVIYGPSVSPADVIRAGGMIAGKNGRSARIKLASEEQGGLFTALTEPPGGRSKRKNVLSRLLLIPSDLPSLSDEIGRIVDSRLSVLSHGSDQHLTRMMSALVGSSDSIMRVKSDVINLSNAPGPVLIIGESGTGKDIIARLLHDLSSRAPEPFYAVNAGAIPAGLSLTELFGSTEGAFTGSVNRPGCFECADGGSLFLDEIGEIESSVQVELLRVLETGRIRKVGSNTLKKINVRLIFATNKNLGEEVEQGRFRSDLLYRIDVFRIKVPPLRERKEDIPDLLMHFSNQLKKERPAKDYEFTDSFVDRLFEYDWPGNVRELRNVFIRAVYDSESEMLREDCLSFGFKF